jgi:hypothetical protein
MHGMRFPIVIDFQAADERSLRRIYELRQRLRNALVGHVSGPNQDHSQSGAEPTGTRGEGCMKVSDMNAPIQDPIAAKIT